MNKNSYQVTQKGYDALKVELEELKSRRGVIADKIAEARDYGDLSENAEYDAARAEQGLVETRIAEIEEILQNASIIRGGSNDKVKLGSTVDLKSDKKSVTYTLVGKVEANPLEGKISNESPIGIALMDKKQGEEVTISTPKGSISYVIASIS